MHSLRGKVSLTGTALGIESAMPNYLRDLLSFPGAPPGDVDIDRLAILRRLLQRACCALLPIVFLTGCQTALDSKMYTTKRSAMGMPPVNTFTLGEHPIVVVQGFENAHEVVLEVLTNGVLAASRSYAMKSGQVEKTSLTDESFQRNPFGGRERQETWTVEVNAGIKVDLGVLAPGSYDLALKTNNVMAATSHFNVKLQPDLEQERQVIETERQRLEESQKTIDAIKSELDQEKSRVDVSNAALVNAYNSKAQRYNDQLAQATTERERFNARVAAYNGRLASYGIAVR
jgi:hypothetical protein